MSSLSRGDEDLHEKTGGWHRRELPEGMSTRDLRVWLHRYRAHLLTHRVKAEVPKMEVEYDHR